MRKLFGLGAVIVIASIGGLPFNILNLGTPDDPPTIAIKEPCPGYDSIMNFGDRMLEACDTAAARIHFQDAEDSACSTDQRAEVLKRLALIHFSEQNFAKARALLDDAKALNASDSQIVRNHRWACASATENRFAVPVPSKVPTEYSLLVQDKWDRAIAIAKVDNADPWAKEVFNEMVRYGNEDHDAIYYAALGYFGDHQWASALIYLDSCETVYPEDLNVLRLWRAQVYYAQSKIDMYQAELDLIKRDNPWHMAIWALRLSGKSILFV